MSDRAVTKRGHARPVWKNTELEARLWKFLVEAGYAIELEKQFGRYRVDVYLPDYHLAFEADGSYHHSRPGRPEYDSRRDALLLKIFGLPVVRIEERELVNEVQY